MNKLCEAFHNVPEQYRSSNFLKLSITNFTLVSSVILMDINVAQDIIYC